MTEMYDSSKPRRPHLTKAQRLPNCYKEVEKIIKSVKSCQTNFKTSLANSRLRGSQFKKVYKLSLNVLKHYTYIQKIIDKTQILQKEVFLRKELASVLIYELLFGNGSLPGESKAVTTVQAYQNEFMNIHQGLQNSSFDVFELNEICIPRYVRVHTLVTTVVYAIKELENYGFKQIFYEEGISEEKYLQLVKSLEKGNFLVDFHFKDVLVFAQHENLIGLDMYKNGHIFLQDKASYIPVHVLNPEPRSTVLDACAAPGMKSAHIASKMKNKGILIACERDESRFETLKGTLHYGAVKISKVLCTDFKLIDPNDEAFSAVEYILLDPSCSGSGMVNRMDEVTDTENSKTKERLIKLAGFQIILLKHALKFPSVKRVVYSTCSIHEEENEFVVHEVLNAFGDSFKLVPVMSEWSVRGLENYKYGKMCLRTVPEKHLTNGFFVAMFERILCHKLRRKNISVNYKKHETIVRGSEPSEETGTSPKKLKFKTTVIKEEISCEKEEICKSTNENSISNGNRHTSTSPKELKFKTTVIKEEISCEKKEICKSTNENSISNGNRHRENSSSAQKKKKKDSYLQQCISPKKNDGNFDTTFETVRSYANYNQNNMIHDRFQTEKSEELKIQFTKHKKKRKKKECATDIQFQSDKESQERLLNMTPSEFIQNCEDSELLKCSPSKMCSAVDGNSNTSITKKKSKHKRHCNSENEFEINEKNCEIFADVKLKQKKRKKDHSIDENTSSFIETRGDAYNSDMLEVLHKSAHVYQNIDHNVMSTIHSNYTEESKELKTQECRKHKEKKKEKESVIRFQSNKQNQCIPNVAFSECLLLKTKNSQNLISSHSELCESLEENGKMLVDMKLKYKTKNNSTDENTIISTQNIQVGNKLDSLKPKVAIMRLTSDLVLPITKCFENKFQKEDKDSIQTTSGEHKKNKKHKKHSKNYDFTANQFNNSLISDFPGCENRELCISKPVENSNSVPLNENIKNDQYLPANSSKCKKTKKHKKHADKYDRLHKTTNINDYSPNSSLNWISSVELNKETNEAVCFDHEKISVKSSNQDDSHVNKKSKKYYNEKTNDASNFHDSNTNIPLIDLVHDISNELLFGNETKITVDDSVHNDSHINKKSKKYYNEKTNDASNFHDSNTNVPLIDLVPDISNETEITVDDSVQNDSTKKKKSKKHKKHLKDKHIHCYN